jgi:hypothetical protein
LGLFTSQNQNIGYTSPHRDPCTINHHPRRWALLRRSNLLDYESVPPVSAGHPYLMTRPMPVQIGAILASSCEKGADTVPHRVRWTRRAAAQAAARLSSPHYDCSCSIDGGFCYRLFALSIMHGSSLGLGYPVCRRDDHHRRRGLDLVLVI